MLDLGLSFLVVVGCFIAFAGAEDSATRTILFLAMLVSVYFFSSELIGILLQNT